jgi:hypothetical protein
MFTSPDGDFFFSVVPVQNKTEVTAPDSIRLQFMVERIMDTAVELERRGVSFDQWPTVSSSQSTLIIGSFHTPNGISIDLWGFDPPENGFETDLQTAFLGEEEEQDEQVFSPEIEEISEPEIDQLQLPSSESETISAGDQFEDEPEGDGEPEIDHLGLLPPISDSQSNGDQINDGTVEDESIEFEYFSEDDA